MSSAVDGAVGGVRRLVGHGLEAVRVGGRGGGVAAAEMVGRDLAGEVVDPGGELALVTVGVAVFQDAVENQLHEVFAGAAVAGEADKKAVERPLMTLKQLAELVDFAGAHGDHEIVVGGGVHGWQR